ncbi:hypothetical protein BCR34DRAFT_391822 [Clohesyomyces aquaticus]|uniref:Mid2 domain-containing protein n=1 Tax=Clohesyomyces aquaticus TaxID=1231657 RepID=A0A1Y1ZEA9_9PLEO|nr:hypothetical protein BCR34DRAFT_391822 [Clohesyomyces aquaticus]
MVSELVPQLEEWGNMYMTPCDGNPTSEKWCCGNKTDCCNTDRAITLAAKFQAGGSSSSTSISSSLFATAPGSFVTTTATGSATNTSDTRQGASKGGLSTDAKACIGVGAVAGALILLGLGFFVARYLQYKKVAESALISHETEGPPTKAKQQDPINAPPRPWTAPSQPWNAPPQSWSPQSAELHGDGQRREMP